MSCEMAQPACSSDGVCWVFTPGLMSNVFSGMLHLSTDRDCNPIRPFTATGLPRFSPCGAQSGGALDKDLEALFRLYGEMLYLKPAITWLVAREAQRSGDARGTLKDLSDKLNAEIAPIPEEWRATFQEGCDRFIARAFAQAFGQGLG
jgi:hypothetical protein